MIYITKEGIPNELNGKIIKIQKSTRWKNIDEYDTNAIRQVFDNEFPKNEMKKILISEQKGLCAYCMRRIHVNSHSRIEHYIPLSRNKEKAIDYTNLLGCVMVEKALKENWDIVYVVMQIKRKK